MGGGPGPGGDPRYNPYGQQPGYGGGGAAAAAAVGDYHLAGKAPRIPPAARLITSIVPPMMLGLEGTQLRNMGDLCSDVV